LFWLLIIYSTNVDKFLVLYAGRTETGSAEEQPVRVNQPDEHLIPVAHCVTGIFFNAFLHFLKKPILRPAWCPPFVLDV